MSDDGVFDTAVIASIFSGFLVHPSFPEVHRAVERLAGGSVWTHQVPRVSEELAPAIAQACPQIAAFDYSGINRQTVDAARVRLVDMCGASVKLNVPMLPDHRPDPSRDLLGIRIRAGGS